jgi:dsDNA-specific endonuclease/ATPase MutS2
MKLDEIIKSHIKKVVKENDNGRQENYMFFSNLQQIHRQCEMLMEMNPQELDQIIQNGHDWADDHVSEAKNNMDQVFDFFMNETKKDESISKVDNLNEMEEIDESKNKPTNPKLWAASLAWARSRYDVCPSAYCNGAAAKRYKSKGGGWRKSKK